MWGSDGAKADIFIRKRIARPGGLGRSRPGRSAGQAIDQGAAGFQPAGGEGRTATSHAGSRNPPARRDALRRLRPRGEPPQEDSEGRRLGYEPDIGKKVTLELGCGRTEIVPEALRVDDPQL